MRFRGRAFSTRRSISYDDEDEILRTRQENLNFIQKIDEIPEKPQDDSEDSGDENSDSDEEENASKSVGEEKMAIEKGSNPNESGSGENKPEVQVTPPPEDENSNEKSEVTKIVEEKKETQAQRLSVGEGKLRKKNSRKSADRLKNKKSNPPPIQIPEKEASPEQNLSPQPSPLQLKDLNLVNYLFGFVC